MAKSCSAQGFSAPPTGLSQERARESSLARTGPYLHLTARRAESRPRSSGTGFPPPVRRRPGRGLRSVSAVAAPSKGAFVNDEPMEDRPRRRPVLLAMLVAAALLLALAGTGFGGKGPSRSKAGPGGQGPPPAAQNGSGQGFPPRGRHCHHAHGGQQPQQDPTGAPPV